MALPLSGLANSSTAAAERATRIQTLASRFEAQLDQVEKMLESCHSQLGRIAGAEPSDLNRTAGKPPDQPAHSSLHCLEQLVERHEHVIGTRLGPLLQRLAEL
jgi:hypothetical protein